MLEQLCLSDILMVPLNKCVYIINVFNTILLFSFISYIVNIFFHYSKCVYICDVCSHVLDYVLMCIQTLTNMYT